MASNVSSDLIWEICRNHNSYLVKRKASGGVQLSRDPLNLVNKHSRKYSGYVTETAIGINAGPDNKGLTLTTKIPDHANKPASSLKTKELDADEDSRAAYRTVVQDTTKQGYRADLRQEAVARASAIKYSQQPKEDVPASKPRGKKALAAAA